jgi:N6-L-threonylcarbamoyladenine synthase
VVATSLEKAGIDISDIEGIAVTIGPGLVGSLLVGISFTKGLSYYRSIRFRGINHIEGHIFAHRLEDKCMNFPFVALVVSGGHTELIQVLKFGKYKLVGRTLDDAAGEAFDKIAKYVNLGYPGGKVIDQLAAGGDRKYIKFPRVFLKKRKFDFSFSGLKTAALVHLQKTPEDMLSNRLPDFLASFQEAIVEVLVEKSIHASKQFGDSKLVLAGGVAANSRLRALMAQECNTQNIELVIPRIELCTDNGAMVAAAGEFYLSGKKFSRFNVNPNPALRIA